MNKPSQKQVVRSMNLDQDLKDLQVGQTRENYNARIGSSKNTINGGVNLTMGTRPIVIPGERRGEDTVIGELYYDVLKKKYSFIYNDLGYHSIVESDETGVVNILIIDIISTNGIPLLRFSKDSKISHINIIQTSDEEHILFWVEFSNPQRKFNITKAKKGVYTPFFKEEDISVAKSPFLYNQSCVFQSDFTRDYNFIKNGPTPQFMTQFIYEDNEKSVWSPLTSIINKNDLPKRDELYLLQKSGSVDWLYNRICCKIDLGHDRVKKVLIGARFTDNGPFKLIGEIDKEKPNKVKYGVTILNYSIDNNGLFKNASYGININGQLINFNLAGASEKGIKDIMFEFYTFVKNTLNSSFSVNFIDNGKDESIYFEIESDVHFNIFPNTGEVGVIKLQDAPQNNKQDFYFYNDGAYLSIDNKSALTPYSAIPFNSAAQEIVANNILLYVNNKEGWDNVPINAKISVSFKDEEKFNPIDGRVVVQTTNGISVIQFIGTYYKGEVFYIKYKTSGTQNNKATYCYAYEIPFDAVGHVVAKLISGELAKLTSSKQDLSVLKYDGSDYIAVGIFSENPIVEVYPATKTQRALKRNGVYQYGIVYFEDKKRSSNIQTDEKCKIFIPAITDTDKKGTPLVSWEIHHTPPQRATGYAWYRTKNLAFQYFRQFFVGNTRKIGSSVELDLSNVTTFASQNSFFPSYVFEEGDRVRLISTNQKPGECLVQVGSFSDNFTLNPSNSAFRLIVPFPIEVRDFTKSWNTNFYRARSSGRIRFDISIGYYYDFTQLTAVNVLVYVLLRNRNTGVLEEVGVNSYYGSMPGEDFISRSFEKDIVIGDEYEVLIDTLFLSGALGTSSITLNGDSSFIATRLDSQGDSYYPQTVDLPINGSNGSKIIIEATAESITPGTFIEIYRPTKEVILDLDAFAEISETYPIINAGTEQRAHSGPIQHQTSNSPATGNFKGGDIWVKVSEMPKLGNNQDTEGWDEEVYYANTPVASIIFYEGRFWRSKQNSNINHEPISSPDYWEELLPEKVVHEADSSSYVYDGYNSGDRGRVEAINPNSKEQILYSGIRYSLPYIQGTQENGLSTFPLEQNRVYESMYGAIKRVHYNNGRLDVLMENKVGSILINERILLSNTGERTIAQSDALLNNFIPKFGDFGIGNHPESYINYNNIGMFVDASKEAICLIDGDKVVDISEIAKVRTEIADLCKKLNNIGGFVYSGVDITNDEFLFTFNLPSIVDSKTIAFNFLDGDFKTFYDFRPHFYSRYGTKLTSAALDSNNNVLHIHDSPNMNNFYGSQYKTSVKPVFNENATFRKIFTNIVLKANSLWYAPEITTAKNEEYPKGMLSRLTKSKFSRAEGDYFASFLRDINTPSNDTEIEKLFKGRRLRGDALVVKLENDAKENATLYSVEVFFDFSVQTS